MTSPLGGPGLGRLSLPRLAGGLPPLVGPTCTPSTGSNFAVGIDEVACTVTDAKARGDVCYIRRHRHVPAKLSV